MSDADWLDGLPDDSGAAELVQVTQEAVARRELSAEEQRIERLRNIEDQLLEENLQIVGDAAKFRKIDPGQDQLPVEWLLELGAEGARERMRVAQAAWLPVKDAPIALKMAQSVALGIIKARATEKAAPRTLNVAFVQLPAPRQDFGEVLLEGIDK